MYPVIDYSIRFEYYNIDTGAVIIGRSEGGENLAPA